MDAPESAVGFFQEGCSCSQAILSAFSERYQLDREMAMRLAAGFGGGIGRLGNICGAVTGAVMVLGLSYGNTVPNDREAKEATYDRVREFARRFQTCHGSLICRDLIGCDISSPEGFDAAKTRGLFSSVCTKLVHDAAMILDDLLMDRPSQK